MNAESLPDLLRDALKEYGPGGEPPEWVVTALLKRFQYRPSRLLAAVLAGGSRGVGELEELVIAYGLGSGRVLNPAAGGWHVVWDKPRKWLEAMVYHCIKTTSRYLEFGLRIEGYAFRRHEELRYEVVQMLVGWLIEGNCKCADLLPDKTQHRKARCLIAHSVKGWNPERCSFSDFIWQAIKGSMARFERKLGKFSPYGLVQGMHFWNLHQVCHLRLADVLVWVCQIDGCRNFEGLPCLECLRNHRRGVCHPSAFRTVIPRLIIPKRWDGRYVEKAYWNCQYCRKFRYGDHDFFPGSHYYPEFLIACPKCGQGHTRGAKRSHVYVLSPREDRSFEENADLRTKPDGHGVKDLVMAGLDGKLCDSCSAIAPWDIPWSVLDELEPIARQLMELRFFEQLTKVEAAQEMGLTVDQAKRLEAAAMRQIAAFMHIKEDNNNEDE